MNRVPAWPRCFSWCAHLPRQGLAGAVVAAAVLTLGCGTSTIVPISPAELARSAAQRGVEAPIVPYELSPAMADWVRERVSRQPDRERRLSMLADALLLPTGLGIEYERDLTATAREVFEGRSANCLSFTLLFVGMAREIGVPAYFLAIEDLVNYSRENDLVVISDHIAVGYGPPHEMTMIDFGATDETTYRRIRPITDLTATALYYSNRGAEALRAGSNDEAVRWLRDAVRIDPDLAGAWVNLGVARRRVGSLELAEDAYRRALEIDPEISSAYHNLSALLHVRGESAEALALLELTDRSANRNPFSYIALGDISRRFGRLSEAERFYRRAVRLGEQQAEPLAALGILRLETGHDAEARRLLRKARRLDPADARVEILAERLEGSEVPP